MCANDQLTYLKQKWSAEAHELDREKDRNAKRLNARVERQEVNKQEVDTLADDLTTARNLLTHLVNTSAPQEMIDKQQALVDKLQTEKDEADNASSGLTKTEVVLQQASIDEIDLQRQYLNDFLQACRKLPRPGLGRRFIFNSEALERSFTDQSALPLFESYCRIRSSSSRNCTANVSDPSTSGSRTVLPIKPNKLRAVLTDVGLPSLRVRAMLSSSW